MIKIEFARRRDAQIISEMSRDFIETGLDWRWRSGRVLRAIRNPDTSVIKALIDSRFAGFAIMRFGREEAHLDLIAVHPAYRRQGAGLALLSWLEESALTAGISIVRLEIRESNIGAMKFYARQGYQQIRRVKRYYCGQETAIELARDLWCGVSINAFRNDGFYKSNGR